MLADLHMHTTFSDGVNTPEELVREAEKAHLCAMAITDHDNTLAYDEAKKVIDARQDGIHLIRGVEMDTDYKGKDVHVLGFHFDPAVPIFQQALAWNRSGRVERVMKIIEKIQSLGYELSFQEVKREAAGAHSLGRPHIARVLVKKGYFPTVKDVFDTLIAAGKPAYLRQVKMSPFEAARIIHKAGGIAVLAHPAEIENLSYVEEILHSGVMDGMEVFHPSVLQEKNKHDWLAIAKKYHLMVSGTGKSFRAISVAHQHGCDGIIDDGLLIEGTKILAGKSAKTEQNKVQAVKRAIFMEKDHCDEVKEAIQHSRISCLLVIGTSDKMAVTICKRLALPVPSEFVHIQDIATTREMKKARDTRIKEGKHIVPVPTIELKPHLSGVLVDLPHRLFGRNKKHKDLPEKSIVRPAFSYYGKISVTDYVVSDIVRIVVQKNKDVDRISAIKVRRPADTNKGMTIYLDLVLFFGAQIFEVVRQLQAKIKVKVEGMTSMPVRDINVSIKSLTVRSEKKEETIAAIPHES